MAKIVSGGIAIGVLGNFLYDLLKSDWAQIEFGDDSHPQELVFPGGWSPIGKVPDDYIPHDLDPKLPRIITGLRAVRKRLGLSVERIATECSVSRQTYLKAERGDPLSTPVSERIRDGIQRLARERGLDLGSRETKGPLPPDKSWP
jgi:hypothetical protein